MAFTFRIATKAEVSRTPATEPPKVDEIDDQGRKRVGLTTEAEAREHMAYEKAWRKRGRNR